MQLFLSRPEYRSDDSAVISDSGLCHQMFRVLRMRKGDVCVFQYSDEHSTYRDTVFVTDITKNAVTIQKQDCKITVKNMSKTHCVIAYPNSAAKAEIIVQKLTEIGIGSIIFWKAARSQAKFDLVKKRQRLEAIIKEAVEQSRGFAVPALQFCESIEQLPVGAKFLIADTLGNRPSDFPYENLSDFEGVDSQDLYCFIGPEGGWGEKDYEYFSGHQCYLVDLGCTVLRMETAAIVSAWYCRNQIEQQKP